MNFSNSIDQLIQRIEAGQVVFFIGAGFSIDSEGNTANRLMRRLLVRFQAMVNLLETKLSDSDRSEVRKLPSILRETFQLNRLQSCPTCPSFPWQADDDLTAQRRSDVSTLSSKYFEANEWFCGTFQRLLQLCMKYLLRNAQSNTQPNAPQPIEIISSVAARDFILELSLLENELLSKVGRNPDPVPLDLLDVRLLAWSVDMQGDPVSDRTQNAGKALFLDTMGFANPRIMGGNWLADQRHVVDDYEGKLLQRFHVLGRLAREGMCPSIITTNYDLLLEGAWRAVGFGCNGSTTNKFLQPHLMPAVPISEMARIGKAAEFFEFGRGNVTANVVKVHGCTQLYREARREGAVDLHQWADNPTSVNLSAISWKNWRNYLPSMVFTFREIQNWRGDSWARDFLATIQRTRTVAFCGYSLQDPVLHDSFRSVYEDMSRQLLRTEPNHKSNESTAAPAYFWSPAGKNSFYATEVLDSASAALGHNRCDRSNHPNALDYRFRNNQENCFPDLDDQFLLIFHRIFRSQQLKCTRSDLTQLLSNLLGRLVLKREIESFLFRLEENRKNESDLFERLLNNQANAVPATNIAQQARINQRQFRDVVNWTYRFGSSLLREMAAIELLQRSAGHSLELATIRSAGWYLPTSWNRSATAWGAVVELALKTLFSPTIGEATKAHQKTCMPAESEVPLVHVRVASGNQPLPKDPIALQIVAGGSQVHRLKQYSAGLHYCVEWKLEVDRFPWPAEKSKLQPQNSLAPGRMKTISPPIARELWQLASLGTGFEKNRMELIDQLSVPII